MVPVRSENRGLPVPPCGDTTLGPMLMAQRLSSSPPIPPKTSSTVQPLSVNSCGSGTEGSSVA